MHLSAARRDSGRRSVMYFGQTGRSEDLNDSRLGRCTSADNSLRYSGGRGQNRTTRGGHGGGDGRSHNYRGSWGGRGGRGGPRQFRVRYFDDVTDPVDATIKLTSKIAEFQEFLYSYSISPDEIAYVLTILDTVLDCDMQQESVLEILRIVCNSPFLDTHLKSLLLDSSQRTATLSEDVERICKLISNIRSTLPAYASKGYEFLAFLTAQPGVMAALKRKPGLEVKIKILLSVCLSTKILQDGIKQTQHGRSRRVPNEDHEKPPNDFTELSIFPTALDVDCSESVFLRAIKTEGAYRDANNYLDVQFRLLREDYIRPLRNGIREYKRMKSRGESLSKNTDVTLYHNVKIISLVCSESLEHRIQFDNSRLKTVRWESCRRLIYGSLVCLTRDDFQTTYFAVVTNRDTEDVREGIIQVKFEKCVHDIMDPAEGDTFIMAETSAYFEAYRHVLEGLQEMPTSFPFARYIVECKRDLKPPNYLLARGLGTTLNISSLLKSGRRVNLQVPVLVPTRWPPLETTDFNQSQYDAVKMALTKELAIIQGPPGTGKTYVGLKVARVLLENRHVWTDNKNDKPMLVVCYTNHALDQFLEGMLEFCPNGIVRVGSRCKSPKLAQFNLKLMRSRIRRARQVRLDIHNSIRDCWRKRCILKERVEQVSAHLEATTKGVVGEGAMEDAMARHFTSLVSGRPYTSQSVMMSWITQGQVLDTEDDEEEDEDEDDYKADKKLNVEEDAEYLQRERYLDDSDDDEGDDGDDDSDNRGLLAKRSRHTVKDAIRALGIVATSGEAREMNGWVISMEQSKRQVRRLQHLLATSQPMSEKEAAAISNVWSARLQVKDRVRLYLYWVQVFRKSLKQSIKEDVEEYEKESTRLRELRFAEDHDILRRKEVIGMTTTAAARYRKVLKAIGCPIVLLEEAAEVLEAHVVTTLHESCQHLILIGDHQQLRPSPTVYELSRDYHLDISLFERLVGNKLHHTSLALQHRMRPEIASLVRHVYPDLRDHVSTTGREHVRGVKHDVFLVHHEMGEARQATTTSKVNEHEADFCLCLCRYLLQQGYTTSQITLLTAYSGQVSAFRSRMRKNAELFNGMRVTTIDNYQGEESDIIVLSLVRSNEEGNVGFLGTDNRVCVALSRAKNMLYAIGNFKILADSSDLWKNIVETAKRNQHYGDSLILKCENHPGTETKVSCKADFTKVPEGGCRKPCAVKLTCGHVCTRLCHNDDREHRTYRCLETCRRLAPACPDGHRCCRKCSEPCRRCIVKVVKVIPMCGHQAVMECHTDPRRCLCPSPCDTDLECGHRCAGKCGECRVKGSHASPCTVEVEKRRRCGHLTKVQCHVTSVSCPCPQPCKVKLDCGHVCRGTCGECEKGRVHKGCRKSCGTLSELFKQTLKI